MFELTKAQPRSWLNSQLLKNVYFKIRTREFDYPRPNLGVHIIIDKPMQSLKLHVFFNYQVLSLEFYNMVNIDNDNHVMICHFVLVITFLGLDPG